MISSASVKVMKKKNEAVVPETQERDACRLRLSSRKAQTHLEIVREVQDSALYPTMDLDSLIHAERLLTELMNKFQGTSLPE